MENNLRDLLDLIYELEGLLHLSLKRDEFQEDFLRLIVKKGKEVAKICDNLDLSDKKEEEKPFDLNEYYIAEDIEKEANEPREPVNLSEYENDLEDLKENLDPSKDRGRLVFSINDKFRFRKDLFENSDVDFNNSLALVASMDDYDEAESYFVNDVGLNPADPTVNDFLEIVKRYFA